MLAIQWVDRKTECFVAQWLIFFFMWCCTTKTEAIARHFPASPAGVKSHCSIDTQFKTISLVTCLCLNWLRLRHHSCYTLLLCFQFNNKKKNSSTLQIWYINSPSTTFSLLNNYSTIFLQTNKHVKYTGNSSHSPTQKNLRSIKTCLSTNSLRTSSQPK